MYMQDDGKLEKLEGSNRSFRIFPSMILGCRSVFEQGPRATSPSLCTQGIDTRNIARNFP
jgi:hypothetical protein